jgi:hypothetical protein
MGYCISQLGQSTIAIKKENHEKAFKAVQGLVENVNEIGTCRDSSGRHFSWVDNEKVLKATNLTEVLQEWRYEPEFDDNGDIFTLEFTGEKLGDDPILFQTLAPFIEKDGEIHFRGEDGLKWKYVFNGKEMKEVAAIETWDDEVADPDSVELLKEFLETTTAREYISAGECNGFLEKFRLFQKNYNSF